MRLPVLNLTRRLSSRDTVVEAFLVPGLILCAILALSVQLGPDASWDLRNYHIYNVFALLHKPPGTDLVPAQMQSFLPPTSDLIPYWLRFRLNAHPNVLDAILGLPAAIAAIIAFRIGLLLLPPGRLLTRRWALVLLALFFGITGAAGLPTIGTAMSEMPGGSCILAGLFLLLRALNQERPWRWTAFVAGALFGAGLGLKLTLMPFVIAGVVMFILCMRGGLVPHIRQSVGLGVGLALGALLVGGPWWLHLYVLTGNPIFPYYNNVFHSPLYAPIAMEDGRFIPRSLVQALFYPFYWGFQKTRLVTELVMRDPRLAFAGIALAVYVIHGVIRRPWRVRGRAGIGLAVFMALGFALWEREFSIFRYVAPIELLSGFLILLALRPLLTHPSRSWVPLAVLTGLCLVTLPFTRYPHWDRALPNGQAASVTPPVIPADGMVLLLTADPMSYIAAYIDPRVRFVGVNNNLLRPGDTTGLAQQVDAAVRSHTGPLWALEIADPTGRTEQVLAHYGLERGPGCTMIQTNLEGPQVRFCPLLRVPGGS